MTAPALAAPLALPAEPTRQARHLRVFRRRVWPWLLFTLGALLALIGLISVGEGGGPGALPVVLLGVGLTARGGARVPGGWEGLIT
ncbi:hypothetical protein DAETH_48570 (plasmid) [Deinococcus aetherius]|uniref:Uncharacterized protein n=1 Tax=Deinococcus aetherius TaxID=200252 RepID=A0ABM8AM06_9DEIO|nr:hypothetical protein [Deinococcus aetherius]BDP44888.1 hypothetical protein DAETH_48570 [Deinococcus aetherius]